MMMLMLMMIMLMMIMPTWNADKKQLVILNTPEGLGCPLIPYDFLPDSWARKDNGSMSPYTGSFIAKLPPKPHGVNSQ